MLEGIPEDFEFVCKWDGSTIKMSDIAHIKITPDGFLWVHGEYGYEKTALISFTENNTNQKLTLTRSSEEFGKLLFAVYSSSVLK